MVSPYSFTTHCDPVHIVSINCQVWLAFKTLILKQKPSRGYYIASMAAIGNDIHVQFTMGLIYIFVDHIVYIKDTSLWNCIFEILFVDLVNCNKTEF